MKVLVLVLVLALASARCSVQSARLQGWTLVWNKRSWMRRVEGSARRGDWAWWCGGWAGGDGLQCQMSVWPTRPCGRSLSCMCTFDPGFVRLCVNLAHSHAAIFGGGKGWHFRRRETLLNHSSLWQFHKLRLSLSTPGFTWWSLCCSLFWCPPWWSLSPWLAHQSAHPHIHLATGTHTSKLPIRQTSGEVFTDLWRN